MEKSGLYGHHARLHAVDATPKAEPMDALTAVNVGETGVGFALFHSSLDRFLSRQKQQAQVNTVSVTQTTCSSPSANTVDTGLADLSRYVDSYITVMEVIRKCLADDSNKDKEGKGHTSSAWFHGSEEADDDDPKIELGQHWKAKACDQLGLVRSLEALAAAHVAAGGNGTTDIAGGDDIRRVWSNETKRTTQWALPVMCLSSLAIQQLVAMPQLGPPRSEQLLRAASDAVVGLFEQLFVLQDPEELSSRLHKLFYPQRTSIWRHGGDAASVQEQERATDDPNGDDLLVASPRERAALHRLVQALMYPGQGHAGGLDSTCSELEMLLRGGSGCSGGHHGVVSTVALLKGVITHHAASHRQLVAEVHRQRLAAFEHARRRRELEKQSLRCVFASWRGVCRREREEAESVGLLRQALMDARQTADDKTRFAKQAQARIVESQLAQDRERLQTQRERETERQEMLTVRNKCREQSDEIERLNSKLLDFEARIRYLTSELDRRETKLKHFFQHAKQQQQQQAMGNSVSMNVNSSPTTASHSSVTNAAAGVLSSPPPPQPPAAVPRGVGGSFNFMATAAAFSDPEPLIRVPGEFRYGGLGLSGADDVLLEEVAELLEGLTSSIAPVPPSAYGFTDVLSAQSPVVDFDVNELKEDDDDPNSSLLCNSKSSAFYSPQGDASPASASSPHPVVAVTFDTFEELITFLAMRQHERVKGLSDMPLHADAFVKALGLSLQEGVGYATGCQPRETGGQPQRSDRPRVPSRHGEALKAPSAPVRGGGQPQHSPTPPPSGTATTAAASMAAKRRSQHMPSRPDRGAVTPTHVSALATQKIGVSCGPTVPQRGGGGSRPSSSLRSSPAPPLCDTWRELVRAKRRALRAVLLDPQMRNDASHPRWLSLMALLTLQKPGLSDHLGVAADALGLRLATLPVADALFCPVTDPTAAEQEEDESRSSGDPVGEGRDTHMLPDHGPPQRLREAFRKSLVSTEPLLHPSTVTASSGGASREQQGGAMRGGALKEKIGNKRQELAATTPKSSTLTAPTTATAVLRDADIGTPERIHDILRGVLRELTIIQMRPEDASVGDAAANGYDAALNSLPAFCVPRDDEPERLASLRRSVREAWFRGAAMQATLHATLLQLFSMMVSQMLIMANHAGTDEPPPTSGSSMGSPRVGRKASVGSNSVRAASVSSRQANTPSRTPVGDP